MNTGRVVRARRKEVDYKDMDASLERRTDLVYQIIDTIGFGPCSPAR